LSTERCTFQKTAPLDLAQHTWTIYFNTRPAFDAATDYTETRLLVFGGVCISLLLFGITHSLASTRQRALALAQQMGEKFRIQERAGISSNNDIFITDASQPHNPIIYVNPAMTKVTGYSAQQILGRNFRFLMGEDTDQPDLPALRSALAEGRECRVILRCYRQDATLFWNKLSMSPVRDELG